MIKTKTVGISENDNNLSNEIRLLTEYQFNCSSIFLPVLLWEVTLGHYAEDTRLVELNLLD